MNSTEESTVAPADARPDALESLAVTLRANNMEAVVVEDAAAARAAVIERVPAGAEVHSGKSKTLDDLGLGDHFGAGAHDWLRARYLKMDRATQGDEMRRMVAAPEYMLGSPQAITESGSLLFASYAGSQIGPLAASARHVILVAGAQKVVPDLAAALKRIEQHVLPYEDARLREQLGVPTRLAKILISNLEARPGRVTVILVRQPLGV